MVLRQTGLIAVAFMALAFLLCSHAGATEPYVEVSSGRLSITAESANFGRLIGKIAEDAGIEVEISPAIASKTLSTDFRNLPLERGIQRLMGLINHRNFFMLYGHDGNIKKIDIYETQKTSPRSTLRPTVRPGIQKHGAAPAMVEPPTALRSAGDPGNRDLNIKGEPYTPPASIPEYLPHRMMRGE